MAVQGLGTKVSGASVLIMIGDKPIGGQTGATINRTADTIDVTNKVSDGYKEYVASWKDWSIDCDAFVVLGDTVQEELETAFEAGTAVTVHCRVGADAEANGVTYEGSGVITSLTTDLGQDDAVTYSLSIQGSAKLKRTVGAKTTT